MLWVYLLFESCFACVYYEVWIKINFDWLGYFFAKIWYMSVGEFNLQVGTCCSAHFPIFSSNTVYLIIFYSNLNFFRSLKLNLHNMRTQIYIMKTTLTFHPSSLFSFNLDNFFRLWKFWIQFERHVSLGARCCVAFKNVNSVFVTHDFSVKLVTKSLFVLRALICQTFFSEVQ